MSNQRRAFSGFLHEAFSFKDWDFIRAFGKPSEEISIVPLERSIEGLPVIFQGDQASCISCAVTWTKQYMEVNRPSLSWEWLASISETDAGGATPKQVLEPARKTGICTQEVWKSDIPSFEKGINAAQHQIPGYFFLRSFDKKTLYHALSKGIVLLGLKEFQGAKDHMIAAYDVSDDGERLLCVNWWNPDVQEKAEVHFNDPNIIFAAVIAPPPPNATISSLSMPMLYALLSKIRFIPRWGKVLGAGLLALAFLLPATETAQPSFGSSSGIFAKYRTTLRNPISSTATSIPVSSLTLRNGQIIGSSGNTIYFPVYLTLNPGGTTDEDVECWAVTTGTTPSWDSCVRGISWLGADASSTATGAAFAHSSGETVIQSNTPFFFNRFLDTFSNQSTTGAKIFTVDPTIGDANAGTYKLLFDVGQGANNPFIYGSGTSTTGFGWGANTFAFNSAGTIIGASSTKGIFLTDSLIGINASSTGSLNGGFLTFNEDGYIMLDIPLFSSARSFEYWGDGSDGDVVISANATLTRDMYYSSLRVTSGVTLYANGFKIYAKNYVAVSSTAVISNAGGSGGDGGSPGASITGGASGTAGVAPGQGSLLIGFAGQIGGQGGIGGSQIGPVAPNSGVPGASGMSAFKAIMLGSATGGNGSTGGTCGGCSSGGGDSASGTAGSRSGIVYNQLKTYTERTILIDISPTATTLSISPGSGSGGGGGGGGRAGSNDGRGGGGGGGSGASGGIIWLATPILINDGTITAAGGNGGNGGQGGTPGGSVIGAGGGGGGGGGGPGGIVLIFHSFDVLGSGTATAPGGLGGERGQRGIGPGSFIGASSTDGIAGLPGKVKFMQLF